MSVYLKFNIEKPFSVQRNYRFIKYVPFFLFLIGFTGYSPYASAQDTIKRYTIEEVIDLAVNYSNDAKTYRNYFLSSYWNNRSVKAKYLPALNLGANLPSFNKQMQQGVDKGEIYYYPQNTLTNAVSLSISQNIALTGGSLSFYTFLNRIDQFDPTRNYNYNSAPFGITYSQSLFTANYFKWEKKLSPMYYEEAKRSYLHNMEAVKTTAIALFFNLMQAQQNLLISKENYANTDTLYKISQKKFSIGSIAKDELMQMKLSVLNAETAVDQSIVNVEANKNAFRSYIGISDKTDIELVIPLNVPLAILDYEDVLSKVISNHLTPVSNKRQLEYAKYNLAVNEGLARPSASLYLSAGANQNAPVFGDAYRDIKDYQVVSLSLSIPIEDWGMRSGNVQMAKANLAAVKGRIYQSEIDLEQSVYLAVMRYNMMSKRFRVAAESDTIAKNRYEASQERFIAGRITVTDLNIAQAEKKAANSTYIYAIREYWAYYYDIERIALFDFINKKPIDVDFDALIKE